MSTEKPIKRLTCCCCGELTQGRQWHNRDTGYGLCTSCVDYVSKKEDAEEMLANYGRPGVHYFTKLNVNKE